LYGCNTCPLTLREEERLRVFENRVLRRIFGPKRGKVAGVWRRMHNEELHNLYASPSIIRMMQWVCCTHKGDEKYTQNFGQKLLGSPRH
jgi:hypothetical protein